MKISAYVPCCNNEATVLAAVVSIQAQSVPVDELFVVDDGSEDGSVERVCGQGIRVVSFATNQGRGAVRARALTEARHELVLSCDAGVALGPDFVGRALAWMRLESVAAVCGRVTHEAPANGVERWRRRHLFKADLPRPVEHRASLATGGVLLRKSHVLAAGNFDAHWRRGEDAELGRRLLGRGYDVVFDPELTMCPTAGNTLGQVLERYWRWNVPGGSGWGFRSYLRQVSYSIKVMAREDLRQNDFTSAAISLLSPHYLFWQGRARRTGSGES